MTSSLENSKDLIDPESDIQYILFAPETTWARTHLIHNCASNS